MTRKPFICCGFSKLKMLWWILVKKHTNYQKNLFYLNTYWDSHYVGSKEPDVMIVYQCTKSTFLPEFGIFKVEAMAGKFSTVKIEELALFSPLNLYTVNKLSLDKFSAVSLNKKPIVFAWVKKVI